MTQPIQRPLILISNDDGYCSYGLKQLIDFVRPLGDIIVVAPDGMRSGMSMAFTSQSPLRMWTIREEEGLLIKACTGTPVDCIKMALEVVVDRRPDVVLAGINHGDNSGINCHYSGTVGIVMEACMKNIPAIAFSSCYIDEKPPLEAMRPYVEKLVAHAIHHGMKPHTCLNVNFPALPEYKGIRSRRMGYAQWINEVDERQHPRGWTYYWMVGTHVPETGNGTSDVESLKEGYATITPLHLDLTDYDTLNELLDCKDLNQ